MAVVIEVEEGRARAMLVSLGGSPAPVIVSINQQRPDYILFFVSQQSAGDILTVLRGVEHTPRDHDRIVSPSAELLADCYCSLRDNLPSKLGQWGLTSGDLTVDYTGGTKSMSAAVVLATADKVHRYSYVGGEERDKGGLGVVVDGREKMWFLQNPWKDLAQEELARVRLYFSTARYQTASEELERLVKSADARHRQQLGALSELIAGYREWDDFRHASAIPRLGKALNFLKVFAMGRGEDWSRLAAAVEVHLSFLGQFRSPGKREPALIRDLVGNADRRARIEHKYEDAVARLYSCMERAARFRLLERSIDNGAVRPEDIPEAIREEMVRRHGDHSGGQLKLPLLASYQLLAAHGDELGSRFLEREEEIRKVLSLRNQAILGHGERPVYADEYQRFRGVLFDLLSLSEGEIPVFPELPEIQVS